MSQNELTPEEIKALKRLVKRERLGWKISGITCIALIAFILIGSMVITGILMYWLSIPIENIPSF